MVPPSQHVSYPQRRRRERTNNCSFSVFCSTTVMNDGERAIALLVSLLYRCRDGGDRGVARSPRSCFPPAAHNDGGRAFARSPCCRVTLRPTSRRNEGERAINSSLSWLFLSTHQSQRRRSSNLVPPLRGHPTPSVMKENELASNSFSFFFLPTHRPQLRWLSKCSFHHHP